MLNATPPSKSVLLISIVCYFPLLVVVSKMVRLLEHCCCAKLTLTHLLISKDREKWHIVVREFRAVTMAAVDITFSYAHSLLLGEISLSLFLKVQEVLLSDRHRQFQQPISSAQATLMPISFGSELGCLLSTLVCFLSHSLRHLRTLHTHTLAQTVSPVSETATKTTNGRLFACCWTVWHLRQ